MTAPPSRRPWWRRKRTWAAVALWLLLPPLYVLSSGPLIYSIARGWLSNETAVRLLRPALQVMPWTPLNGPWERYNTECLILGYEHAAASD